MDVQIRLDASHRPGYKGDVYGKFIRQTCMCSFTALMLYIAANIVVVKPLFDCLFEVVFSYLWEILSRATENQCYLLLGTGDRTMKHVSF